MRESGHNSGRIKKSRLLRQKENAMTKQEIIDIIDNLSDELDGAVIGIRFDNAVLSVGDRCHHSRHNPGRDDERDFPEYGTPEYDELPELPGTSCYYMASSWDYYHDSWRCRDTIEIALDIRRSCWRHAYIVSGNSVHYDYDMDDGEALLDNCIVRYVIN